MILLIKLAAWALLAGPSFAKYVIPFADGSDGWEDAVTRAKAQLNSLIAQMSTVDKLNITQQSISQAPVGQADDVGYPGLFYADGSSGLRGWPLASSFDTAINAAASFDKNLIYRRGVAMGLESKIKGIGVLFGPGVNLLRTPEAGRNFEYFGADPYLSGKIAAEHVKGVQSQNVISMMRHYIGNDQESGRNFISSNFDDRTAHELYLWPYQDAVRAGVASAMCSYNAVNNIQSCSNPTSLGKWLHEELNFQGFVLSDYAALYQGEELAAANAGCDTILGPSLLPYTGLQSGQNPFGNDSPLHWALGNGTLSEERLDDMAVRVVAAYYKVGQDKDFPSLDQNRNALSDEHNDLIRELAGKSIVLLKNENQTLPLKNVSFLTVFGQSATVDLFGFPRAVSFIFVQDDDQGAFGSGQGSSYANFPYLITPFEALQSRARKDHFQINSFLDNYDHDGQNSAAVAAEANDAFCLVDVRQSCSEGYDIANLTANWEGDEMILAVASACSKTIVAYSTCNPFNVTAWVDHPNVTAIINAGGGGQEAGHALADVLFGDVNPSARLPYTVGYQLSDYAALVDFEKDIVPLNTSFVQVNYTEGLFIDYRWFDKQEIRPAFEFGFGLSYTTFEYRDLSVSASTTTLEPNSTQRSSNLFETLANVSINVSNSGNVGGTEIPQLYIGSPAEGAPVKVLRGFEAVWLDPGETQTVSYQLTRRDLSSWDIDTDGWNLPSGPFALYLGASSRDIRASANFTLILQ